MIRRRQVITGLIAATATARMAHSFNAEAEKSEMAEIRAVWLDRSSLVSREEIKATIQQLALANFNLILINVWSRGVSALAECCVC